MFSIAAHAEGAISNVCDFISSTETDKARHGGILCLHLIGIESRIVGRFTENFTSRRAREALYGFLRVSDLRDQVLSLLVRDPWPDDVSHIFDLLEDCPDTNCTPLVNALFRYKLKGIPFGGTLSHRTRSARVFLVDQAGRHTIGDLYVLTRERPDEPPDRINALNKADQQIIIQWGEEHEDGEDEGRTVWKFRKPNEAQEALAQVVPNLDVHDVVYNALMDEDDHTFRFCELSDPFNFRVKGSDIFILSPPAAKALWIEWRHGSQRRHGLLLLVVIGALILAFVVTLGRRRHGRRGKAKRGEQSPPAYPEGRADAPSGSAEA